MKKYVQVILVVLSIFSLVSLLVYRHEYNKLRYVLEVLNFFGTPGVPSANVSCTNSFIFGRNVINQPSPSWQRVSNAIYVYSAFWNQQEDRRYIKAIAIGLLNENLNYGCYIWYNGHDAPVKGVFSFSAIVRRNARTPTKNSLKSKYFGKMAKNKGFVFYCYTDDSGMVAPSAVTFYKMNNDETAQAYIPVTSISTPNSTHNSSLICIMPVEMPLRRGESYFEFLSFHSIIGIKQFFVYGGEYMYNVLDAVKSNIDSSINVQALQWNYPFVTDYDLMRSVAEEDCLHRSKGHFKLVLPLTWSQFFVPKFHSDMISILHDYDEEGKVSKFQFSTVLFCLEYNDDPKSTPEMPLVFRKSRYALPKSEIFVNVSRLNVAGNKSQRISKEIAAVHWYTKCDMFDLKIVDNADAKFDHSILRFNSDSFSSRGLKLRHGH